MVEEVEPEVELVDMANFTAVAAKLAAEGNTGRLEYETFRKKSMVALSGEEQEVRVRGLRNMIEKRQAKMAPKEIEDPKAILTQIHNPDEDVAAIKKLIAKAYGPLVVGRVFDILENGPKLEIVQNT